MKGGKTDHFRVVRVYPDCQAVLFRLFFKIQDFIGLEDVSDALRFSGFRSGGNKQKVAFGKWTGRGSEILILDCPTRGVDIGVKQAMYQLMYQMRQEGKSIILISEEMAELIGMSDRLLIMKDGKIEKELKRDPQLTEADVIQYMI